jgi:mannitol-1-phosphate 5-dehydrogenase
LGRTCIHFGAGALGRGLVLPRLAAAGWAVIVVDPVTELLDRLRADGGYALETRDGAGSYAMHIPLAGIFHPQDDAAALADGLASASLVTTAVRRENLEATVRHLAMAWAASMPPQVSLVACENVERVDELLHAMLDRTSLSRGRRGRLDIPRTVVDRICANKWPETTTVRTEIYSELAISQSRRAVAGFDVFQDVDAMFDRKRYLVNTFADAAAILGLGRGYAYLSEAFRDDALLEELAPLLSALQLHLQLKHGLTIADLKTYTQTSRERLADDFIPRRLDTVARNIWRKMEPGERFFAPLIDLAHRGRLDRQSVAVTARLVVLGNEYGGDRKEPLASLHGIGTNHACESTTGAVYNEVIAEVHRLVSS